MSKIVEILRDYDFSDVIRNDDGSITAKRFFGKKISVQAILEQNGLNEVTFSFHIVKNNVGIINSVAFNDEKVVMLFLDAIKKNLNMNAGDD